MSHPAEKHNLFDLVEITETIKQLSRVVMAIDAAMTYGPNDAETYIPAIGFISRSLSGLAEESKSVFNDLFEADREVSVTDSGEATAAIIS